MSLIKSSQIQDVEASKVITDDSAKFISKAELDKIKEIETKAEQANTLAGQADTKAEQANIRAEQAFQSASNGKSLVASAITAKGVPTDATATYQTMADNIDLIETSLPTQSKTVTPSAVDVEIVPDNGYALELVTVKGDPDLVGANIREGSNIFGVAGTFQGGQLDISGQVTKTGVFMTDVTKGDTVKAKLTEGEFNELIQHGIDGVVKSGTGYFSMDASETYLAFGKEKIIYLYKRKGESFELVSTKEVTTTSSSYMNDCRISRDGRYVYSTINNTTGTYVGKIENDTIIKVDELSGLAGACMAIGLSNDDKYVAFTSMSSSRIALHLFKRDGDTFTRLELPATMTGLQSDRCDFDSNNNLVFMARTAPFIRGVSINETTLELTEMYISQPTEMTNGVAQDLRFNNNGSILVISTGGVNTYIYEYNLGNLLLTQNIKNTASTTYKGAISFFEDYMFLGGKAGSSTAQSTLYKRSPDTLLYEETNLLADIKGCQSYFSPKGNYFFATIDNIPYIKAYKLGGIKTWIYKSGNNLDGSFSSFGYVRNDYASGSTGQYIEHFNR